MPCLLNFALTNVHLLMPKYDSLTDYFEELDLSFAIESEMWFCNCDSLEDSLLQLESEHGISFMNRMRKKTGRNNPGGGIYIAFKSSKIAIKEHPITGAANELICAKGKIHGNTRHLFVIGAYYPRNSMSHSFMREQNRVQGSQKYNEYQTGQGLGC